MREGGGVKKRARISAYLPAILGSLIAILVILSRSNSTAHNVEKFLNVYNNSNAFFTII